MPKVASGEPSGLSRTTATLPPALPAPTILPSAATATAPITPSPPGMPNRSWPPWANEPSRVPRAVNRANAALPSEPPPTITEPSAATATP